MTRLLLMVLLAAWPLAAQEQKQAQAKAEDSGPLARQVFILKYASPSAVAGVLRAFTSGISTDNPLHALAVTCKPDVMPAIEDAIKRLDVPPPSQNIEVTAYYLIGGDSDSAPGGPPPKELESVIAQLKNSLAFKSYRLLDALELHTRGGTADTSGSPGPLTPGSSGIIVTQFRVGSVDVNANDSTVRINGMKAGIRMPVPGRGTDFSYVDLGLSADVDIKQGQKVVVGRTSMNKDQALFLVLTARIVN